MQRLTMEEFSERSDLFDHAVEGTRGIDHFCSASDWVLPASQALMPARESWIFQDGECFWAFMRGVHSEGFHFLEPLEAMWALACPSVGAHTGDLVEGISQLCTAPTSEWRIMALPGLPEDHELFTALVARFAKRWRLGLGRNGVRLVADLSDGFDAFLARRSKNFRRSVRRSQRAAQAEGIEIVEASADVGPDALYQRILAVEARAWKGLQQVGITTGAMHDFYQLMMPRLCRRGAQRVLFARRDETDVAYIFGATRLRSYRGLQFSFDNDFQHLGLGNVLQMEQIRRLSEEGFEQYDLGMHMDYKLRWADRSSETMTLLLIR